MQDTRNSLLTAVKTVVAQYGLTGFSTRRLAEQAKVNSGLIYHYFNDKDDLMLQAYERENGALFSTIIAYINEVDGIPISFREKTRLLIYKIWREFCRDRDRVIFCSDYYHSVQFKDAGTFHASQLEQIMEKIGHLFSDKESCTVTVYSILSVMYDNARRAVTHTEENNEQLEQLVYRISYSMLCSALDKGMAHDWKGLNIDDTSV